ncbi:VOC family protein [uncultured Tateyamaria sp.]|uniref:VOC family protein n=1 Tax=uncultured Tateyamaria sp. TaxID=455651 RepID=UPI00261D3A95|nr:VOC family protein [uncultured Tateyamaria sp.]
MERVQGFGGFFFRSSDPEGLAAWYRDMLGINLVPTAVDQVPWMAEGGATVFAPFAADTDYFAQDKAFMLNFRVSNLDAMAAQLEDAGVAVKMVGDMPGIGRFAHLTDPEGTPIELWEPAAPQPQE